MNTWNSSLTYAAYHGYNKVAKALLDHPKFHAFAANVMNTVKPWVAGENALHIAVLQGNIELVKILLEHPKFTKQDARISWRDPAGVIGYDLKNQGDYHFRDISGSQEQWWFNKTALDIATNGDQPRSYYCSNADAGSVFQMEWRYHYTNDKWAMFKRSGTYAGDQETAPTRYGGREIDDTCTIGKNAEIAALLRAHGCKTGEQVIADGLRAEKARLQAQIDALPGAAEAGGGGKPPPKSATKGGGSGGGQLAVQQPQLGNPRTLDTAASNVSQI